MSEQDTDTLFEFPCDFPIKAMGKNNADLDVVIVEIIRRHVDDLNEHAVTIRESKGGKFVSVTVQIQATSKQQLDAIYMDLTACPDILMAL